MKGRVQSWLTLFILCSMTAPAGWASPQAWVGFPSADATDGKYVDISGPFFFTPYIPTRFFIAIPSDATSFDIEIFDGDMGDFFTVGAGEFDVYFPVGPPVDFTYSLTATPLKQTTGGAPLVAASSFGFANAAWSPLVSARPVDAAAQSPAGIHFYRLDAVYNGDPVNDAFLNGYLVRVRADSPTAAPQISVHQQVNLVGGPIHPFMDVPVGNPGNNNDGDWNFFTQVSPDLASVTFQEQDADYQGDASSPGSPMDDFPGTQGLGVRISPDIRYEIFEPDGTLIVFNPDPSGDFELESFTHAPPNGPPAGLYRWHWIGVDGGNTFSLFVPDEMCTSLPCDAEPFLIGDTVWFDRNGNGQGVPTVAPFVQEGGETGISGVVVNLVDQSGRTIASTVTDASGLYSFNVESGAHTVEIDASNFNSGNPLEGQISSTGGEQQSRTVVDQNVLTYDFGYRRGSLGDFVWQDHNGDGVFQPGAGEIGIPGVIVQLEGDADGDGTSDTLTTVTDGNGFYLFEDLAVGTYRVTVLGSNFAAGAALDGAAQTFDFDAFQPGGALDNQTTVDIPDTGGFDFRDADFGYFRACGECDGKVSELTLRYLGSAVAFVEVIQKKDNVLLFSANLGPGATFSFVGQDNGSMGTEIQLFVNGNLHVAIHTSCSQPIGPGLVAGDFVVADGFSRNGGLLCPLGAAFCSECEGGVTELTLVYLGPFAQVRAEDGNATLFSGVLDTGDQFTVLGTKSDGKFDGDVKLFVDGQLQIKVHTSCSKPIGPGIFFGNFKVLESFSRDAGRVCPMPCQECGGGVTRLTLRNDGPAAFVEMFDKDIVLFTGTVAAGGEFSVIGTEDDGKFDDNNLDLFIDGNQREVHVSCSKPIGPGVSFGQLTVSEAFSRDGGLVCPEPGQGPGGCQPCDGGATQIEFRNIGPALALRLEDGNGVLFSGNVNPGDEFTIDGTKSDGKFDGDVEVFIDGVLERKIHTSCSVALGPGVVFGHLEVIGAVSRDGGEVCPLECAECNGGVTRVTLVNNGPPAFVEMFDADETLISSNVATGEEFTILGTKVDGKFDDNDIDILVGGQVHATIHMSCSKPIGPGTTFGDFEVVQSFSRGGGEVCPEPGAGGQECTGKIRSMTLQYIGPDRPNANVEIRADKFSSDPVSYVGVDLVGGATILTSLMENGSTIDATAHGENELGSKTRIFINGVEEVIHTSCSTPFRTSAPAPLDNPKGDPSPHWFVIAFTQN